MSGGRNALAKLCTVLGGVLLLGGFGLIVIGLIGIWMTEGFASVLQTMSPFNIYNYIMVVLVLAPGFGLLALAEKIGNKKD